MSDELLSDVDDYVKTKGIKSRHMAFKKLIQKGLVSEEQEVKIIDDLDEILSRKYSLHNIISMLVFLENKKFESRSRGYTVVKVEELERLSECIQSFNDLLHNISPYRERFRDEGYNFLVEVIEESRRFM